MRRERFRFLLSLNGLHPTLGKSGSGGDHRGTRHPDLLRNCVIGHAFGSQQDHLAFACHLLGCVLPARSSDSNRSLCLGLRGKALAGVNMPHYSMTLFLLSYLYMTGH